MPPSLNVVLDACRIVAMDRRDPRYGRRSRCPLLPKLILLWRWASPWFVLALLQRFKPNAYGGADGGVNAPGFGPGGFSATGSPIAGIGAASIGRGGYAMHLSVETAWEEMHWHWAMANLARVAVSEEVPLRSRAAVGPTLALGRREEPRGTRSAMAERAAPTSTQEARAVVPALERLATARFARVSTPWGPHTIPWRLCAQH